VKTTPGLRLRLSAICIYIPVLIIMDWGYEKSNNGESEASGMVTAD